MTKAYSRNEEDFHEDLNDVLYDLESDGYLEVGTPLWEGEIKRPSGASMSFGVVDQIINQLHENAFEEAGEHAGDWPNLPKEKLAELGKLIADWIDTNAPPHFFTVQNVKQIEVTEEMLADFQGVPAAGVQEPHPPHRQCMCAECRAYPWTDGVTACAPTVPDEAQPLPAAPPPKGEQPEAQPSLIGWGDDEHAQRVCSRTGVHGSIELYRELGAADKGEQHG